MSDDTKLTFLTTTKDNIQDLIATYSSLVLQDITDFRWVVYDGSHKQKDDIESLVNQFAEETGIEAKYIHRFDRNIYEAMNNAIDYVDTEYVLILNSGDMIFSKTVIPEILEVLDEYDVDILHGKNVYINHYGDIEVHHGNYASQILKNIENAKGLYFQDMVCQQSLIYRKSVLKDIPLNESLKIAADHDNFINHIRNGTKMFYWQKPVCVYFAGGFSFRHPVNCVLEWCCVQLSFIKEVASDKVEDHRTPRQQKSIDIFEVNKRYLGPLRDALFVNGNNYDER